MPAVTLDLGRLACIGLKPTAGGKLHTSTLSLAPEAIADEGEPNEGAVEIISEENVLSEGAAVDEDEFKADAVETIPDGVELVEGAAADNDELSEGGSYCTTWFSLKML